MDPLKFKEMFISETEDQLNILNKLLVDLEKNPADNTAITKLFRIFHTLKGNAATLEYVQFSGLAHSLEDVLSKLRDNKLKLTPEIMDLLLEGCDVLETGLEDIANDKSENLRAEDLLQELDSIAGESKESFEVNIKKIPTFNDKEKKEIEQRKKKGFTMYRIIVIFTANNPLKTAKMLVIFRNLSENEIVITTTPSQEYIKKGKFQDEAEIVIATKREKKDVESTVKKVSSLAHVFVLGLNEEYHKPEETIQNEKEMAKSAITNRHHQGAVKQIQSVKVNMSKLDKLMNLVGELLISNIRIQDIRRTVDNQDLKAVAEEVDRLTLELQDEVMGVRMVPIGNIFSRFPRMVRDLAKKEGKKVNLIIEGQDIEFDRTVLDEIGDPLIHLLRNSVDHGIESIDERLNAGKEEGGTIKLVARREKNNAVIEVYDDGAGIDPEKVKKNSLKKGIITAEEAARMTPQQLQMLVFKAGVSTNDIVTDVSGRGVGMDVVLSKVKAMGGEIIMESVPGKGTKVIMQLPLTVAIIAALLVRAQKDTFAIPLSLVNETLDITASQIKTIQGNRVFVLRDTEIPLFGLGELIGHKEEEKNRLTVVTVNKNRDLIGLAVDDVLSQQQVLIKGLNKMIKGTKGVAGATILGDGTVALILDIRTLL